jgi:hypothetical protein
MCFSSEINQFSIQANSFRVATFFNRIELPTTIIELIAIAKDESTGLNKPIAANGKPKQLNKNA